MNDQELTAIRERMTAASPGPWFVRHLDDDHAMNLIAVTSRDDGGEYDSSDLDSGAIVAATLVQAPRYVDHSDQRWLENAEFIAHARQDIPRLLDEIARLMSSLEPSSTSGM